MTKNLTTVDQKCIKYWRWGNRDTRQGAYHVTDGTYVWQYAYTEKWFRLITEFGASSSDYYIPDTLIVMLGIPLAYK